MRSVGSNRIYALTFRRTATSATGAQTDKNPFRFSSKYYDADTELYDYGFRHYDPSLGRWINRDPIGELGGINLYGFVGNSPGNAVDPYGLDVIVNIRDGDEGIVSKFSFIFKWRKIKGGKGDTVIDLIKPSKQKALAALSEADQFYFWGHGWKDSSIWVNDDETIDVEDLNKIAKIRTNRGKGKMSSAFLESCFSANSKKGVNAWLGLTKQFSGYVGLTFDFHKGLGKILTFTHPINYDPSKK